MQVKVHCDKDAHNVTLEVMASDGMEIEVLKRANGKWLQAFIAVSMGSYLDFGFIHGVRDRKREPKRYSKLDYQTPEEREEQVRKFNRFICGKIMGKHRKCSKK